jgi:hypothetical protein
MIFFTCLGWNNLFFSLYCGWVGNEEGGLVRILGGQARYILCCDIGAEYISSRTGREYALYRRCVDMMVG